MQWPLPNVATGYANYYLNLNIDETRIVTVTTMDRLFADGSATLGYGNFQVAADGSANSATEITVAGDKVILSNDGSVKCSVIQPASNAEPIGQADAPTHTLLCFKTNDGRIFKVPVIEVIP
jgi:hypothetical protein